MGLEVQVGMSHSPGVYVGSGSVSSHSCIYAAKALTTEPSPQPLFYFLNVATEVLAAFPADILSLVVSSIIVTEADNHWQSGTA